MKVNTITFQELNSLSEYLSKFYSIRKTEFSKESKDDEIKETIKKWIKIIFTVNLIIVQSKSANAIRHFFPRRNLIKTDFFSLLKLAFKVINIDISKKEENPAIVNNRTYFYFQNYKSIMLFLLYCEGESLLLDKINKIKNIFTKSEVYISFTEDFMGQIFGEKGIIHQNNLTITKFFTKTLKISSHKRHSFYRWREEKYLPVQVVLQLNRLDIFNQNYDTNFFKYISSIKFGKTKSEEKFEKSFLVKIKKNYQELILNLFPQTESNLGNFLNLIFTPPKIKYERRNFIPKFDEFISNYALPDDKEVTFILKEIRKRLLNPETDVILKSLSMKNFKSYDEEVIDFEDGINIFYGSNGSGKTTIIEAIFFSLFHLEVEFDMNLRQAYDYENLPFIEPIAETIPISFVYPKVNVIQKSKNYCRVILELLKGDNPITIKREVWRSGKQELSINGNDVLKEIREKLEFVKLIKKSENKEIFFEDKPLIINREKGEISFPVNSKLDYEYLYDEFSSHVILKEIHKSYGDYEIFFDIEEIYASFNNNYRFIDSVSIEDSINLDYYDRFFGLHYLIDTIDHYIEGLGKNEILIGQNTSLLHEKLNYRNIFRKINQINDKIFKIGKIGDKCISCGKNLDENELSTQYVCQECGSIYCGNCVRGDRKLTQCEKCDADVNYFKFKARIYLVDDFYSLIELKGFYKDLEVENGLNIISALGIPYLIGAFLDEWSENLLEDTESIQLKDTVKKVIHQYENLVIEVKEGILEDLSNYDLNLSIKILFSLAKKLINETDKTISLEDDVVYFLTELKSGRETPSTKIINFLILNTVKKYSDKNNRNLLNLNLLEKKVLELHWNRLKIEIDEINEIELTILRRRFESWNPYEIRQIELLIKLSFLLELNLNDSRIEKLLEILEEIFYYKRSTFRIRSLKHKKFSENLDEILLDHKILVIQMRNQLQLIEEIYFNNEMVKHFISTLKSDEKILLLLKDIYCYLFKINFEITQNMYKEESKAIFGDTDISSFIDDSGSLKIIYKNSEEIYPFENLSGGERSKFLLILVSILIKLSNKNTFYLIDEPNELIDPLNIDYLKKTLYNLFNNKQIVICTFIENYKNFKPALIYRVNKGADGTSRLEREISHLSRIVSKGNSMISGITGSGKTRMIKRYLTLDIEENKFGRLIIDNFGEYGELKVLIGKGNNLFQKIEEVPQDSKLIEFIDNVLNCKTLFLDISPLEPESQNIFLKKLLKTISSKADILLSNSSKTILFLEDIGFNDELIGIIENLMKNSQRFNISLALVSQKIIKELVSFIDTFVTFKTINNEDFNILLNINEDFTSESFIGLKIGQAIVSSKFLKGPLIINLK